MSLRIELLDYICNYNDTREDIYRIKICDMVFDVGVDCLRPNLKRHIKNSHIKLRGAAYHSFIESLPLHNPMAFIDKKAIENFMCALVMVGFTVVIHDSE